MSGRRAGFCAGFDAPGFMQGGRGWGGGFGWGRGRGWRAGGGWRGRAVPWSGTAPDEREVLVAEAATLRARLDAIARRLEGLEKSGS